MTESIQQIAKEMRDAAGDFTGWGRELLEGFANRLDAAAAPSCEHDMQEGYGVPPYCCKCGYTAAPVVVGEDVFRRALLWLASDDTGSSSEAIVYHMLGLESEGGHPHDPSDLGRCLRMLELFPAWKPRIEEMATYSQEWARLAPRWSKLSAMMADEVGIDWSKGKRAPRTYAAMTAALAGD